MQVKRGRTERKRREREGKENKTRMKESKKYERKTKKMKRGRRMRENIGKETLTKPTCKGGKPKRVPETEAEIPLFTSVTNIRSVQNALTDQNIGMGKLPEAKYNQIRPPHVSWEHY